MTDDLMQDIEAEYLYQCRRSFETQDCGIAANLLDRIKTELSEKDARIAALEAALREAYEVYAGSDGFIAETAAESYLQQLIGEMVAIIGAGLKK